MMQAGLHDAGWAVGVVGGRAGPTHGVRLVGSQQLAPARVPKARARACRAHSTRSQRRAAAAGFRTAHLRALAGGCGPRRRRSPAPTRRARRCGSARRRRPAPAVPRTAGGERAGGRRAEPWTRSRAVRTRARGPSTTCTPARLTRWGAHAGKRTSARPVERNRHGAHAKNGQKSRHLGRHGQPVSG